MIYFKLFIFSLKKFKLFLFINLRFILIPFNKYLIELKGHKILDFGCGHGLFSYYFSKKKPDLQIYSYDIDLKRELFLKDLIKSTHIKNIEVINTLTPIKNNKFDSILIIGVLSLFKDQDIIDCMSKLNLILNDNGKIIISEILFDNSFKFKLHNIRENFLKKINFTKGDIVKARSFNQWEDLFNRSGFKVEKNLEINVPFHSTIDLSLIKT